MTVTKFRYPSEQKNNLRKSIDMLKVQCSSLDLGIIIIGTSRRSEVLGYACDHGCRHQ
jgi:hypothetical protein